MIAIDAVTLWQKGPKAPQAELHVVAAFPFSAKYSTSIDAAPAARIRYVNTYKPNGNIFILLSSVMLINKYFMHFQTVVVSVKSFEEKKVSSFIEFVVDTVLIN